MRLQKAGVEKVKKTFIEYKVSPEHRDMYMVYMQEKLPLWPAIEWLESQEQPGLFLEIHTNAEEAFAEQRQADSQLLQWTEDGRVRAWAFRLAGRQDRS